MPNTKVVGVAYEDPQLDGAVIGKVGGSVSFFGAIPAAQAPALSVQRTSITHTIPGTSDYAIQDLTQTSPFGFVTKDEGNTVLQVVKNLQSRFAELETALRGYGLLP